MIPVGEKIECPRLYHRVPLKDEENRIWVVVAGPSGSYSSLSQESGGTNSSAVPGPTGMFGRTKCRTANTSIPIMQSLANIFIDLFSTFSRTLYALCGLYGWTKFPKHFLIEPTPIVYYSADLTLKVSMITTFCISRCALQG
jgi:hypothetical protein